MGKKILVVDDEKLIVKGIRFSLEQEGMEVDCAYDGEDALNHIQNKEYDMILLYTLFGLNTNSSNTSNSFAVRLISRPAINTLRLSQSSFRSPY